MYNILQHILEDRHLVHVNDRELSSLKRKGGGKPHPLTGLPSFGTGGGGSSTSGKDSRDSRDSSVGGPGTLGGGTSGSVGPGSLNAAMGGMSPAQRDTAYGGGYGVGISSGGSFIDHALAKIGMTPEEAFARAIPGFTAAAALNKLAGFIGNDVGSFLGRTTGITREGPAIGLGINQDKKSNNREGTLSTLGNDVGNKKKPDDKKDDVLGSLLRISRPFPGNLAFYGQQNPEFEFIVPKGTPVGTPGAFNPYNFLANLLRQGNPYL